jgi:hypothetical protein
MRVKASALASIGTGRGLLAESMLEGVLEEFWEHPGDFILSFRIVSRE